MKPKRRAIGKYIDEVQIIGFCLSIVIAIGLLIAGKETIESISLGLVLAVLTQLIDLQVRQTTMEDRLLKASALSKALYSDEWLYDHAREIVNSCLKIKDDWPDTYIPRAESEIVKCRRLLRYMAIGELTAVPSSTYLIGRAYATAEKSIRHVSALENMSYWQSTYALDGLDVHRRAIERGVSSTRIFTQPLRKLAEIVDILEKQAEIGIDVWVVDEDDNNKMPRELRKDFMIVDQQIAAHQFAAPNGDLLEQRITITPDKIEEWQDDYESVHRYAKEFEKVVDKLRKLAQDPNSNIDANKMKTRPNS